MLVMVGLPCAVFVHCNMVYLFPSLRGLDAL